VSSPEDVMPPIMKAYLQAGARLCRNTAIDMDFQCTDFFTILDLEDMQDIYARKYLR
jgi:putative hemolysin